MASDFRIGETAYGYAGFWWRALAAIIDGFIANLLTMIVGGVVGFQLGSGDASLDFVRTVYSLTGLFTNWLYFAICESSSARGTPGKLILGIRVVDEAGERIGFGRASGRYFAKFLSALILFVGFMMAGWTRRKQALHDLVAGCLVVRQRPDHSRIRLPA